MPLLSSLTRNINVNITSILALHTNGHNLDCRFRYMSGSFQIRHLDVRRPIFPQFRQLIFFSFIASSTFLLDGICPLLLRSALYCSYSSLASYGFLDHFEFKGLRQSFLSRFWACQLHCLLRFGISKPVEEFVDSHTFTNFVRKCRIRTSG